MVLERLMITLRYLFGRFAVVLSDQRNSAPPLADHILAGGLRREAVIKLNAAPGMALQTIYGHRAGRQRRQWKTCADDNHRVTQTVADLIERMRNAGRIAGKAQQQIFLVQ